MSAENHPDYKSEIERCVYTLDYVEKTLESTLGKKQKLDAEIDKIKRHFNSESSENYSAMISNTLIQSSMSLKIKNLYTARSKPYFARVDFREEVKSDIEKLYIGKMSLMTEDQNVIIVDWRAPIANLYYEERLGGAHYNCPDGDIKGQMLIKRQFSIEDGKLLEIFDIDVTASDEILQSYLGASADNRLKEIVSTIQAEQNKIIRADMWRPMIVQGAAGSGKTTIALHRIAYLIYTHEKTLKPENFMIIAPNKLFLNYISEVLPELGVERVLQTTFENFAMDLLGKKFKIKEQFEKLTQFIKPGTEGGIEASQLYKATRLKTSMKFKEIIDRYVELIEKRFIPKEDLKYENTVIYTYAEINNLFLKDYKRWPLVKRIDEIKKNLNTRIKALKEKIEDSLYLESDKKIMDLKNTMEDNEDRHTLIVNIIDERSEKVSKLGKYCKVAITEYIKRISKFSPWQYYTELLGNEWQLAILADGLADGETVEYMASYTNEIIKAGYIEIEDFAPLIYLKYLIYGIDEKIPVRQVIIDEAQDFSVFQLYALNQIIKDSSFTILGDLSQGIHSYRGVNDWQDVLTEVFGSKKGEFLTLEQSYRTTVEVMNCANILIDMLNNDSYMKATPVIRHGEPVVLKHYSELHSVSTDIAGEVKRLLENKYKSLAIICKTLEECQSIYNIIKSGLSDVQLITGKEESYKGGVVVVPSYLSKGLEFDAAFIVGLENYRREDIEMKLLYVSMTRALHYLSLYYVGEKTEIVQGLIDGGIAEV